MRLSRVVPFLLICGVAACRPSPDATGSDTLALIVPPRIDTLPTVDSMTPSEVDEFRRRELWGDIDSIIKRRYIRIAVPWSRTWFYLDGVRPAGMSEEFGTRFT